MRETDHKFLNSQDVHFVHLLSIMKNWTTTYPGDILPTARTIKEMLPTKYGTKKPQSYETTKHKNFHQLESYDLNTYHGKQCVDC